MMSLCQRRVFVANRCPRPAAAFWMALCVFQQRQSFGGCCTTTAAAFSPTLPVMTKSRQTPTLSGSSSRLAVHDTREKIFISDAYDGGNIELIDIQQEKEGDPVEITLQIKPDPYTELEKKSHFQYFSFRSTLSLEEPCEVIYKISNAKDASYAPAWEDYTVAYSNSLSDPHSWNRDASTEYTEDGSLVWKQRHEPPFSSTFFAYFPPFSYERHLKLIAKSSTRAKSVEVLGQTLDGRDIECIQVGDGPSVAWIIHRQHPGEHMAEYYAEGLLTRLLGLDNAQGEVDGLVHKLKSLYTFYIVPSMCPDGGARGHLRTNAAGANLNREWASSPGYDAPSLERSPEVYHVLKKMDQTGCDIFLDIHGDELLPYNFLAQSIVPNWGPRLEALHGAFLAAYSRTNSDMQQKYAYEVDTYKEGDVLNIATDQIAARFDCLSATLEMPFKDCASNPDPSCGWSPTRAYKLGASVLEPLAYIQPYLRAKNEFWNDLPSEDNYVLPTSKFKPE